MSQGRRLQSDVPQTKEHLLPHWSYHKGVCRRDEEFKQKQKQNFDNRHRVKPLPEIPDDTVVWVTTDGQPVTGRVVTHATTPRSYVANTSNSTVRHNSSQINVAPNSTSPPSSNVSNPIREPITTQSHMGTPVVPPDCETRKGRCGITGLLDRTIFRLHICCNCIIYI